MSIKAKLKTLSKNKKLVATSQFDCLKFINALTIFIRKKYKTIDDELIIVKNKQYKQEINSN